MTAEQENLALFYRTMTTEQLQTYRAALQADLAEAERRPRRAARLPTFCRDRIGLIEMVLSQRGVQM